MLSISVSVSISGYLYLSLCFCIFYHFISFVSLISEIRRQSKRLTYLCGAYANAASICDCFLHSTDMPYTKCDCCNRPPFSPFPCCVTTPVANCLWLSVAKSQFMRIHTHTYIHVYLIHRCIRNTCVSVFVRE